MLLQTLGLAPKVIVGSARIVTVMGDALLTQPVAVLLTVNVALYTAGAAAAGTVIVIGLAGNTALTTFTKPAPRATASKVMLYRLGVPVVAEYGRLADIVPEQTEGLVPNVMVGLGLILTVMAVLPLTQPDTLFRTLNVAL